MHILSPLRLFFFFFFNDTATTEIYTLSLHDALPISTDSRTAVTGPRVMWRAVRRPAAADRRLEMSASTALATRSEEHTSELQSPCNLVCRLLLEKKKKEAMKRCSVVINLIERPRTSA